MGLSISYNIPYIDEIRNVYSVVHTHTYTQIPTKGHDGHTNIGISMWGDVVLDRYYGGFVRILSTSLQCNALDNIPLFKMGKKTL